MRAWCQKVWKFDLLLHFFSQILTKTLTFGWKPALCNKKFVISKPPIEFLQQNMVLLCFCSQIFNHFTIKKIFFLGESFGKKFEEFGLKLMKISKIRKWLPSKPLWFLIFAKKTSAWCQKVWKFDLLLHFY